MSEGEKTAMEMGLEEATGRSVDEQRGLETRPGEAKHAAAPAPAEAPAPVAPTETNVVITDAARERLARLVDEEKIPEDERFLRIAVIPGGCSGFSYQLGFDHRQADDHVLGESGIPVIIDPKSAPHLAGLTVDFVDTIEEQGFKLTNPNATSTCGCGESFQT